MSEEAPQPRTRAEAFSALIHDQRISHGAFRTWHLLYDCRNSKTGLCNPGHRYIAAQLHCHKDSPKVWLTELRQAGWVDWTEKPNPKRPGSPPGVSHHYTLLDGQGLKFSVPTTRDTRVPKRRGTKPRPQNRGRSVPQSGDEVPPKQGTKLTPYLKGNGGGLEEGGSNSELGIVGAVPASASGFALEAQPEPAGFDVDSTQKESGRAIKGGFFKE